MPSDISGFASVELSAPDQQLYFLTAYDAKTRRSAARDAADRYERQHREQPSAACLIKAQWALAMQQSGRARVCPIPRAARVLPAAALVGVYFGLYCNPPTSSVHERLGRTLEDILSEAPADVDSLSFVQLYELLTQLRQHDGTLCERAAMYGKTEDVTHLMRWVKGSGQGTQRQQQDLLLRCAQMGLDALLKFCAPNLSKVSHEQRRWAANAVSLIEAGARLRTLDQLNTLTQLALFGETTALLKLLPSSVYGPQKVFGLGAKQRTPTQWLLVDDHVPARREKLEHVLSESAHFLWYPSSTPSPWELSFADHSGERTLQLAQSAQPAARLDPHSGESPLHVLARLSSRSREWDALAALLISGFDLESADGRGETALDALRGSEYAIDLSPFDAWLAATRDSIDTFAKAAKLAPHRVLAILLHRRRLGPADEAVWLLTRAVARRQQGERLYGESAREWLWAVFKWLDVTTDSERAERRATFERAVSFGVIRSFAEEDGQLHGEEWRLLRILLGHVANHPNCLDLGALVRETMDDIRRAREKPESYRLGLIEALCDFRAVPLDVFSTLHVPILSMNSSWPTSYWALHKMQLLNTRSEYYGLHLSSALARRLLARVGSVKDLFMPLCPDAVRDEFEAVKAAVDGEPESRAPRGRLARLFEADAPPKIDAAPLSDDLLTAERLPAPTEARAPQSISTSTPEKPQAAAAPQSPATQVPEPAAEADEAAPTVPPLQSVLSRGIEPLLRDLGAGRLNEVDLDPLRRVAEMARREPTFLRGPLPLVEGVLQALRQATPADAEAVAARASAQVRLVHEAVHQALLHEVILGTAGIGENERLQRTTRRLVARSFAQLTACALGESFATAYLGEDSALRASTLRNLLFRVAPDRNGWAQQQPAAMEALTGLFQLVSGFKALHTNTPNLARTLSTLLPRSSHA